MKRVSYEYCYRCNGRGWLSLNGIEGTCPDCGGRGWIFGRPVMDRVSDSVLVEHIENAEAWLDNCECHYEHDYWALLNDGEKAEIGAAPEYCEQCVWWRQDLALKRELQRRRAQGCTTCAFVVRWLDELDGEQRMSCGHTDSSTYSGGYCFRHRLAKEGT